MHPTMLSFSFLSHHFEIQSYPFFLILSSIMVFVGSIWYLKNRKLYSIKIGLVIFAILISGFIGARLLHGWLNLNEYLKQPTLLYIANFNGFSLFGGIILSGLTGFIICRIWKIDVWKLADTITPQLGIGIAIVRIGCFLNGCCFGKITELPWGVTFPLFSEVHKYQLSQNQTNIFTVQPVHPTEIYELIAALFGSLLAVYLIKRNAHAGIAFLSFSIWFTAFRWFEYYLMVLLPTFQAPQYFYPILYLTIIIVCLFFLIRKLFPIH
jgi:phosphatidylglycerol---prolipoprotein diacylglyceryl transferase